MLFSGGEKWFITFSYSKSITSNISEARENEKVVKQSVANTDALPLLTAPHSSRVLGADSSPPTTSSRVLSATEDGLLCPFVSSFVFWTRQRVTRQPRQTTPCCRSKHTLWHTLGLPANRDFRPLVRKTFYSQNSLCLAQRTCHRLSDQYPPPTPSPILVHASSNRLDSVFCTPKSAIIVSCHWN